MTVVDRWTTALHPDGKLHALPELIVEVLSPGMANIRRDREDKPDLYARNGVLEYWLVDWQQHALEVYRNDGTALRLFATLTGGDTLSSPLLADFEQPIAPLFAPTDPTTQNGFTAFLKRENDGWKQLIGGTAFDDTPL